MVKDIFNFCANVQKNFIRCTKISVFFDKKLKKNSENVSLFAKIRSTKAVFSRFFCTFAG